VSGHHREPGGWEDVDVRSRTDYCFSFFVRYATARVKLKVHAFTHGMKFHVKFITSTTAVYRTYYTSRSER
jgi:hypothetical protein